MVDPISVVGSAASILQLVGNVCKGLRTLRDTVIAIRDAPTVGKHIDEKIRLLEYYFTLVEKFMKQNPSGILDEFEFRNVIQDLATNCHSSISVLQESLPSSDAPNVSQAFRFWVDKSTIKQALKRIDDYTKYLTLLLDALQLFKLDDVDKRLQCITAFLDKTSQPRRLSHDAALSEEDRKARETVRKVRAFTSNTITTFVSFQAVNLTSLPTPRSRGASSTTFPGPTITVSPGPRRKRKLREVECELAENRKISIRLKNFGLYDGVVELQRRALDLNKELAIDHDIPFNEEERDVMKEELAEILLRCRTESSDEEAMCIFQKLLHPDLTNQADVIDEDLPPVPPTSAQSPRSNLSRRHKLGQIYKDRGRMAEAMENLRIVFDAYTDENPKDTPKIKQVGEQLVELYDNRLRFGGAELRGVLISQLQGFRHELEDVTGRPLEHPSQCDAAMDWCQNEGIHVSEERRFDIIDDDGSSPLHCAAQNCHKVPVICQMLENSDTLENKDQEGDTPLLVAVGASNLTALTLILQKGGSLGARDRQRQTALHRSQDPGVTRLLLQQPTRRASTATADFIEQPRRDSSSSSTVTVSSTSPLPGGVLDINAQDANKKTALYNACHSGREKIVNLLLDAGADPNIARHDHSPLAAAIESRSKVYRDNPHRQVKVVAALINKGAKPESVRDLADLQKPRGKFREIQKALEGRAGSLSRSLSNMTLQVWDSSSDRTSLSSSSAISSPLELLDLGPASLGDIAQVLSRTHGPVGDNSTTGI